MRLRGLILFALVSTFSSHLSAQSVISTRSGLINFSEGMVFVDGQPLSRKYGSFERLKNGSTLVTESGRAEVLLSPNSYLRIGEKSSVRMVADNLSDTRMEVLAGSAILDSQGAAAGDFVKLIYKDATIRILMPGRYRVDAEPPQLRVFDGEAEVERHGEAVKIEASPLLPLDGAPVVRRFTEGSDGLLDIWSDERHSMISSNLVSSQAITDPLLDNGPDSADYLASMGPYGGYIPLASVPPVMGGYYGYSGLGYPIYGFNGLGYNPYGYAYGVVRRPYVGLAIPSYSRILSTYGVRTGTTPVFGVRPSTPGMTFPRPVFAPRPNVGMGAPARVGGVRAVGHR